MRKYGVLAAAAGLALSGSLVKADFVISSNRVNNGATDTVTFFVQNTNSGDTANTFGNLASADVAFYAPPTAAVPNNGIFVSALTSGINSGNINVSSGTNSTVFAVGDVGNISPQSISVLKIDGTTVDSPATPHAYTNGQQVAGLGVAISGNGTVNADASSPLQFASIVVPAGGPVELLQNVHGTANVTIPAEDGNRTILTNFEPSASEFSPDLQGLFTATNARTSAFVNGVVPEPASLALVGLGLGGLMMRRRRSA